MGLIQEESKKVLEKYAGFGCAILYLYQEGKVSKEDLENIFLKVNSEIAFLYLEKVVHQIDEETLVQSFATLSARYPKEECLREYFGMQDTMITLKPDVYETALNYRATGELLEGLSQEPRDVKDQKMLSSYQSYLSQMVREMKEDVVRKADNLQASKVR